jgi:hypothetical protein
MKGGLHLRLGCPGEDYGPLTPMREPAERWIRWDLLGLPPARAALRKQPAPETVLTLDGTQEADGWRELSRLLSPDGRQTAALIY